MLILLPPSETKAYPAQAPPVELSSLVLPELAPARAGLLKALVRLARGRAAAALDTLGLSEGQAGELAHNRNLWSAPAGMAAEVYTGVLYDVLDLPDPAAPGPHDQWGADLLGPVGSTAAE
jgi:cytoplasmic iron level regulating protein YaaA (DUF328/UPF0246 family)